jgi:hypothetical protein
MSANDYCVRYGQVLNGSLLPPVPLVWSQQLGNKAMQTPQQIESERAFVERMVRKHEDAVVVSNTIADAVEILMLIGAPIRIVEYLAELADKVVP